MADRARPTHLTLRLLRLPTRSALTAAHGVPTGSFRLLTIVGLHVDGDLDHTVGWGECSALNEVGYTHESSEGAFELLRDGRPFDRGAFPMAAAAVEMAVLDADLKHAGQSLADRLGTAGSAAPAGAVVGLGRLATVLPEVEQLVDAGYRRIKCKITAGHIVEPIAAVRAAFPEIEVHVDANGSLGSEDVPALQRLVELGVRVIEQPFAPENTDAAARLVASAGTAAVAADESLAAASDVDALVAMGAATAVVVKPAKLGGLAATLELLDRASAAGLGASVGGMLESGLGRHVLAALAPRPELTLTGDLSPARRWLAADPFPDISMRRGRVAAPARAGIAGEPARNTLERFTVRRAVVEAAGLVAPLPDRLSGVG